MSKQRFPNTLQLGDITKINGIDIEPVDIICAGSPCLTADSLILTEDGYKPISEVRVGELVLTKSNTWHKVLKKFDNGEHETCYISGTGFENIHCTLNHKFWARVGRRSGHFGKRVFSEPEFVEAKDLTSKHYIGVPIIETEKPFYTYDKDFWWLVGYYLGDGWITKRPYEIQFACNDIKLTKLKEHLSQFNYTIQDNKTRYRLRFADKDMYNFLKQYIGTGCCEKHIPLDIINLPKEQLMEVYNGYLASDGCIIDDKHQFSSINRRMIYEFMLIINKLFQKWACVYKVKTKDKTTIEGRTVNQKDYYLLRFSPLKKKQDHSFVENGYLWLAFRKREMADVTNVYNMEVEDDHSYIVQGIISKNCQDLSVSGNRAGLVGERSGLFYESIRVVREMQKATKGEYPKFFVWENVCFGAGTLVTTTNGFIPIEQITEGMYVKTKSGNFEKVLKVYKTPQVQTVTLSACGAEPLTTTSSHPFWVRRNNHTQPRSFAKPTWVAVSDIHKGDYIGYKLDGYGNRSVGLPIAYAVGRWLADGCVVERNRKQKHRIFISTGYAKYEKLKKELEKLPYNICENKMKHAINFTFTSDEFADIISECGRGAGNKKVPQWVFELTKEEQAEILRGYLEGDGYHRRKNEYSFYSISRELAYGLARLVRNVYHVGCSIYKHKARSTIIKGREVNTHDGYDCSFNIPIGLKVSNGSFYEDGFVWCRVKDIIEGEGVADVYNLSVETDNTYEANGICVHNCGAFSTNKGNDFRAVLEEITETEIPMPKSGKWATAGMVRSGKCEVAWRVLDAQYWGVSQRRKRIFLVADFRTNGRCAGEILFVEEGLSRNTKKSGETRESITSNVKESIRKSSEVEIYDIAHRSDVIRPQTNETIPTMTARYGTGGNNVPIVFEPGVATRDGGHIYQDGKAPTLRANPGDNFPTIYTLEGSGFRPSHNGKGWNDNGVAPTFTTQAAGSGGICPKVIENMKTIRKLTPLECERLQGLPDHYTLIDDKTCSDSARYKAIGNGMAQPCSDYIIQRIVECAEK